MDLISLVVALLIVGVVLWAITQIPLDPTIRQIIRVLVIVFALFYCLRALGLWHTPVLK